MLVGTEIITNRWRRLNEQSTAAPDHIPVHVLRTSEDQLGDIFSDIFCVSLSAVVVPTCLKTTKIIPVKTVPVNTHTHHHKVLCETVIEAHEGTAPKAAGSGPVCTPQKPDHR